MRKISPVAIVLLASSAPTNRMFPLLDASAMKACVIVLFVPVDAGRASHFVTVRAIAKKTQKHPEM